GANRMTASTKRPDVILIARGGGSLEDLWGFNDEILVRAVYSSDIPVITAIGHETDTCLIDLASDYRAPTPTAAAGKLFPDIREVKYKINQDIEILKKFIFDKLANFALRYNLAQQKLISRGIQYQNGKLINFERLSSKISKQALVSNIRNKKLKQNNLNEKITRLLEQKLNNYAIKQEKINSELLSSTKGGIRDKSYLLSSNNRLLDSLNYKKTLNRGYAIIKDQDKSIIESKKVANQHKLVNIMFSDGEITVRNQNDK
ncbi:MAG: exodeoxyribonuclease VII large subunit, partial [Pseudomonadota bacterium]|nr:exodeoxyribonuclease VII large subunit [Pseudomonadota bacterium]